MKKIALLIVGLMASGIVSAKQLTGTGAFLMSDCPTQLNEDVNLILSSGVNAGVICDTAKVAIGFATCHLNGNNSDRSEEEETCVDDGAGNITCTTDIVTVSGASVQVATTKQGTVRARYPGSACDAGVAEGVATTAAAE